MVTKLITVEPSRCAGCRYCEMWCSFTHEGVFSTSLSRITVVKDDLTGMDYPIICRFCNPSPYVEACPTNALRRGESGVIVVDESRCTGCGSCVRTCPYGAVKMHSLKAKPLICDLCGSDPVCFKKCPTNALATYPP